MKIFNQIFIVIAVLLIANSCYYSTLYNTVLVEKDDFKNRTKTYISFRENAHSLKTNNVFYRKSVWTYLSFQNYQNDSIIFPVKFYLSVDVLPETDLNNEFFIKIDSGLHKLNFDTIRNHEYIRKEETSKTTTNVTTTIKDKKNENSVEVKNTLTNDSCSNQKEKEAVTETEVINTHNISEYTIKKVRGYTILNDDICREMLYSNTLEIRYYLNDTPYSLKFNMYKLKKLKEFLKEINIQ
ncbi:MAG TPA: hypothetical protein ENK91_00830 [Bacteroidetes bacterium]|nr:hypothetical protein [Bacteroidota bacterium]